MVKEHPNYDEMMAKAAAVEDELAAEMPDEAAALRQLHRAYTRLQALGWNDLDTAPTNGQPFYAIQLGVEGVATVFHIGKYYWMEGTNDLWPARPVLFRLFEHDRLAQKRRLEEILVDIKRHDAEQASTKDEPSD